MTRLRMDVVSVLAVVIAAIAIDSILAQDAPAPPAPGIKGDAPRVLPAEQTQTSATVGLGSRAPEPQPHARAAPKDPGAAAFRSERLSIVSSGRIATDSGRRIFARAEDQN